METTAEITSHFLKALCNSSFLVIFDDRYLLRISTFAAINKAINQGDRFYGSSRKNVGVKNSSAICQTAPNSNLISISGEFSRVGGDRTTMTR